MSYDPYQPCPCGAGKKMKFCCASIAPEMEKVQRLREGGQQQQATATLRRLNEQHPDNAWVATSLAGAILNEDEQPRRLLRGVLAAMPDNPLALGLLAVHSLSHVGYQQSKPVVHRALQKASGQYPQLISQVVFGIAQEAYVTGRFLMAREHLVLALRLVEGEEERRQAFMRLLEFEGDDEIPYPLRSVHQLVAYEGPDERVERHSLARRLSHAGLWEAAATVLTKLCDEEPETAALWRNRGFCHAWDGEHTAAAEALHRAAGLTEDFEAAVELETIAQLLDHDATEDRVGQTAIPFKVESVSRLLTTLDNGDRLVRVRSQTPDGEAAAEAGSYHILDRPRPTAALSEEASLEDVAEVVGQVLVFDGEADEDGTPRAFVSAFDGEPLTEAAALFETVAGDNATRDGEASDIVDSIPRELQHFQWRWHFHESTPPSVRRSLEKSRWTQLVDEIWPATKQVGLGDRTPTDVRDDESARVALAAAIAVFDAYCDRSGYELDVAAIRERFGLPAPEFFALGDDEPLNALSSMQLTRLEVGSLTDEQLVAVVDRGMLVHHNAFLVRMLTEVLERPSCREQIDVEKLLLTLAELARQRFDLDAALDWAAKGLEQSAHAENPFENSLRWRMLELHLRLEKTADDELTGLLDTLWNDHGGKLPQLRSYLQTIVEQSGIEVSWAGGGGGIVTAQSAPTSSGGVWTPGDPEPASSGESEGGKLWVPGQ